MSKKEPCRDDDQDDETSDRPNDNARDGAGREHGFDAQGCCVVLERMRKTIWSGVVFSQLHEEVLQLFVKLRGVNVC